MDIALFNIDDNSALGVMRDIPDALVAPGNFIVHPVLKSNPQPGKPTSDRLYEICSTVFDYRSFVVKVIVREQYVERSSDSLQSDAVINAVTTHLKSEGL